MIMLTAGEVRRTCGVEPLICAAVLDCAVSMPVAI